VQEDLLIEMSARLQAWAPHRQTTLRSSTNAEDLEGFSGAGLYESIVVPANPSPGQVADALREVWASVWLQRAFEERDWYRIAHRAVAMAVLVQPMVEDAVATGVAITGNPFKRGQEAVFINTQWAGTSVTGALGDQVPEQYLVATWTGVCEPELISRSSLAGGAPILSEDELLAQTAQLQRIHRSEMEASAHAQVKAHAKVHTKANAMDVEFALTRQRRFVILQARPYTIVYSLDRAQPQRRKPGWPRQLAHRLRRLSHRLQQGWRELTGAAVRA
jgi:phosphoenolpyruvate synthase/pyruvate phosphate dikinase